jgi:hypothetical protein
MHMPPEVWGPFFWHTMHITALGYPKEPTYAEKKAAKEFFESLIMLIPCSICRTHYAEHLKAKPISPFLDTRQDVFLWTIELHNAVNKSLNKAEMQPEDSIAYYKKLGNLGRSPIWTPEDFNTIQLKSISVGAVIGLIAGMGISWLITSSIKNRD